MNRYKITNQKLRLSLHKIPPTKVTKLIECKIYSIGVNVPFICRRIINIPTPII